MNRVLQGCLIAAGFSILSLTAGAVVRDDDGREWNFRVFLDDSEIGYHNFRVVDDGDTYHLTTEAEFKVRFLFITAYKYLHSNSEKWQGGCLAEITSQTDANGQAFAVSGTRTDAGLSVRSGSTETRLPGCVKTFAYWNPDILDEPRLMNSQTGEFLDVEIEPVAQEVLTIRGEDTAAQRYRLLAKNMELDVWYSDEREWLALESTVKGGRKLRYQLQ